MQPLVCTLIDTIYHQRVLLTSITDIYHPRSVMIFNGSHHSEHLSSSEPEKTHRVESEADGSEDVILRLRRLASDTAIGCTIHVLAVLVHPGQWHRLGVHLHICGPPRYQAWDATVLQLFARIVNDTQGHTWSFTRVAKKCFRRSDL